MGAETETDGQGDAMKQKWHKLYDNTATYYIFGIVMLIFGSLTALNIWIYRECNVVSEKIALMLVLDVPGAAFFILANKPQAFSRFLTRCSFDAEGIHCRSPRWGHFTLRWDEIRTYGFTDSNLNHTGIYLYSKGKIMIHLTFDYKTDEKCTTPGQYLKYHRTFQGLSTRELAEKVGIVPATLVLYENDRHPIKHSTAVALANALGIDRNRLLDKYTAFVDYPYSSLLKKVRQDLSLTQIQMAELIGIGQTSYSGWEREIRVPRRKEYDKILAALEKLRVNVDTYLCQSASI